MSVPVIAISRPVPRAALGLAGLAAALAIRVEVAGAQGARSIAAGLFFGALVALVAAVTRPVTHAVTRPVTHAVTRARVAPAPLTRSVLAGVAGAAVLCVPAAIRHASAPVAAAPLHGYLPWATGVVVVAVAEEALLRGSLFTALEQRVGAAAAVGVTGVAFALLHVPLYGAGVLPLDLAVGVWLGVLRLTTGSVVAPAVAHSLADLAGWWLR